MPVVINGTSGITDVDGTAAAPALTGTDTDTGIFFPAANTMAFSTAGTEDMRIDPSGNVGIGTTSTLGNSLLNVAQGVVARNSGATQPYFQSYNSNAGTDLKTWRIGGNNSGGLAFETVNDAYTAATNRVIVDSSGNVGIGTASPATRLDVNGSIKGVITSGTAVASTSGTSIDFTGIPSWAKRITIMLNGVSTNGTANIWLQIGAGSIETTGYTTNAGRVSGASCTTFASISTAFIVSSISAASDTQNGTLILSTLGSNAWTFTGTCLNPNGPMIHYLAGVKTTSGALDRVRVTTSNGTDTFDAGSINIMYEG